MRFLSLSLATLASVVSLAAASSVLEVTDKTWNTIGNTPSLVEFYATWCGHCKNLAPTYDQLGNAFSSAKGKVNIVKIDADGPGKAIGQKYGVKGFPTLKWFPNGIDSEPVDYDGGRSLDDLAKFVTEKSGVKSTIKPPPPPATRQIDYKNFLDVALDQNSNALVAFTASWCGHCKALKPTLEILSKTFKDEKNCIIADFDADAAQNRPLAQSYDVTGYPTLKFFPKGSTTPITYEGGRSEADLVKFLNEQCGTQRAVGGGLTDLAGRVASLDTLANQFYQAIPTSRSEIYKEATSLGESLGEGAAYYLRVMSKLVNGTDDFLEKESKRLASILKKRTLAPRKLDEIKIKANILSAFVEEKAAEGAETVSEKAKEAAAHIKAEL